MYQSKKRLDLFLAMCFNDVFLANKPSFFDNQLSNTIQSAILQMLKAMDLQQVKLHRLR